MDLFHSMNLAVSWGLLVLIWLVQIIIYPGFHRIPAEGFRRFHRWYTIRIAVIVIPLMAGEVMLTIAWIWSRPRFFPAWLASVAVAAAWLSTFALQVPLHRRLRDGKRDAWIRRLVTTNWLRTLAWSVKAIAATAAAL